MHDVNMKSAKQFPLFLVFLFVGIGNSVDPLVDGPAEAMRLGKALNLSHAAVMDMTNRFAVVSRIYCNSSNKFLKEELSNVSECHPLTKLSLYKTCRQEFFQRSFNMSGQCPEENRVKLCSMKLSDRRNMEQVIMNCISARLTAKTTSSISINHTTSVPTLTTMSGDVQDDEPEDHNDQDDHDHKEVIMTQEETRQYVLQRLIDMLDCYEAILLFKKRS